MLELSLNKLLKEFRSGYGLFFSLKPLSDSCGVLFVALGMYGRWFLRKLKDESYL